MLYFSKVADRIGGVFESMNAFCEKLDFLLAKNGIRRADLSRGTNIPETSIRNWYQGKIPSVEVALTVAKFFGVSVEWLFSDAELDAIEKMNALRNQPELNLDETQPLNYQEQKLLESFRKLKSRDKNIVLATSQMLESL